MVFRVGMDLSPEAAQIVQNGHGWSIDEQAESVAKKCIMYVATFRRSERKAEQHTPGSSGRRSSLDYSSASKMMSKWTLQVG